jgi:p-methyltransferase
VKPSIDCVIVGLNIQGLREYLEQQEPFKDITGGYHNTRLNSIAPIPGSDGSRVSYIDFLNMSRERGTGQPSSWHPAEVPGLNLITLYEHLTQKGFSVETVPCFSTGKDRLIELAQTARSVAITTTYYFDESPINEIADLVRQHAPDCKIIVGGPHLFRVGSLENQKQREMALKRIKADYYVVDSQGEEALAHLLSAIKSGAADRGVGSIPNVVHREGSELVFGQRAIEHNPLIRLFDRWGMMDSFESLPVAFVQTSRGCPFRCAFCSYPASTHHRITLKPLEVVEAELLALRKAGVRYLSFVDDSLNIPLKRFKELCRFMIKEGLDLEWSCFFRCSEADDETFELMRDSGCVGVFLGIESGSQKILDAMNKKVTIERYEKAIEGLNRNGVMTSASFIIGFPGETEETIEETLSFINRTAPFAFQAEVLFYETGLPTLLNTKVETYGISGSGHRWSHGTMDWRRSLDALEYLYLNAGSSLILGTFDFSIVMLPYLLAKGISLDGYRDYLTHTSNLHRRLLSDPPEEEVARLAEGALDRCSRILAS